jgi:hypothetical protein
MPDTSVNGRGSGGCELSGLAFLGVAHNHARNGHDGACGELV